MPESLPNLQVTLRSRRLPTLDQLAAIPEEEVWLAKQRSRQTRYPVVYMDRPAINRDEGGAAAFSKAQARKILDMLAGLRHSLRRPASRVPPRGRSPL